MAVGVGVGVLVVVGFDGETVRLADRGFDWGREVPLSAFSDSTVEPRVEGGVPEWGY